MQQIRFVEPVIRLISEIEAYPSSIQLFPPHVREAARRYRFDGELKNDPVEYQRIYGELKIEAALLVIVGVSVSLSRPRTRSGFH